MTRVCRVCLSWAAGKHKDFNYNFQAGNFPPLSLNRRQRDITRKYHRSLIFCVWTGTHNPLEYIIPRLRLCIIHHLLCSVSKLSPQCWSVNTVKTLLLPASSEAPKGSAPCLVPRGTSKCMKHIQNKSLYCKQLQPLQLISQCEWWTSVSSYSAFCHRCCAVRFGYLEVKQNCIKLKTSILFEAFSS